MIMSDLHFFLGGNDLEMMAIRRLLRAKGIPADHIHDKHLGWGAKVSDYESEIVTLPKQAKAVLIELENDLNVESDRVIVLDHHGARAGIDKPSVLEQLWHLLEMPQDQWGKGEFADYPLIVANDKGYIPAMRRMGASDAQIADIRARDRAAQGITQQQERQAEQALREKRSEADGKLIVVDLPHSRIAPVTDRLMLDEGYRNLLIVSPEEINFSGDGILVNCLSKAFPDGWYGGELPARGYWGITTDKAEASAIEIFLRDLLAKES